MVLICHLNCISESVTAENSSSYFSLIDEFLERGLISSNIISDQDLYNQALDIIKSGQYLSLLTSISLFEFAFLYIPKRQ